MLCKLLNESEKKRAQKEERKSRNDRNYSWDTKPG